jgi:hypothetical protein
VTQTKQPPINPERFTAWVIAAKMTGLTVAQLKSGAFYNTNR